MEIGNSSQFRPVRDAFARSRESSPETLFDSKQIFDNLPLFWDDQEVSGGGTGSTHSSDTASTAISVSDSTAGERVRQTYRRFNYQPGKSHLIMATFAGMDSSTGITKEVGYFDSNNGIFLRSKGGYLYVVQRSSSSGAVVDTEVIQSQWNIDKLDSRGGSGKRLDISKSQILLIDLEWLGVGRVRVSFVIDGYIAYFHEFLNANNLSEVYMSTPNLPVRYGIANDGTGPAASLMTICSTVISEGGAQKTGIVRSASTGNTQVDANSADTLYAVIGIRLKSAYIGATVLIESMSMLSESNGEFEWSLWWNPTVAGTFTYADETNSAVQTAKGATANTVSGGYMIESGYANSDNAARSAISNALILGSAIDGTVDQIVLAVRTTGANADIQGTLVWRELL